MIIIPVPVHRFTTGAAAVFAFVTNPAVSTTSSTSQSFTSVSIGTASASRRVFVAVSAVATNNTATTLNSATIAGVSATIHKQNNDTTSHMVCAVISAVVTTGTTGTIALTFSNTMVITSIGVYTATGYGSTAVGTSSALGASPQSAAAFATSSGGFVVAAGGISSAGATAGTTAYTNITAAGDYVTADQISGTNHYKLSSASSNPTATNASFSTTLTSTGGTSPRVIYSIVSWV